MIILRCFLRQQQETLCVRDLTAGFKFHWVRCYPTVRTTYFMAASSDGVTFAAVAVGQTSVKVYGDQKRGTWLTASQAFAPLCWHSLSMLTVWPRAGTPPAENTMLNDDDEDDEDHKSFAELVEENAFAIETFLYLLFLVLFTSYAVLAHGSSFSCLCM
jgi:hypothetical protein